MSRNHSTLPPWGSETMVQELVSTSQSNPDPVRWEGRLRQHVRQRMRDVDPLTGALTDLMTPSEGGLRDITDLLRVPPYTRPLTDLGPKNPAQVQALREAMRTSAQSGPIDPPKISDELRRLHTFMTYLPIANALAHRLLPTRIILP